jgi:hypothetical protein
VVQTKSHQIQLHAMCLAGALLLSSVANAFSTGQLLPETALQGSLERTTLVPLDASLGEPTVEGASATVTGRLYTPIFGRFLLGPSAHVFGIFQAADLEQKQFGKQETGTFDSSVYGIGLGVAALYRHMPWLSQLVEINYDRGLSGKIEAEIGMFKFKEEISALSRVSAQTTLRFSIWNGLFAEAGVDYSRGGFSSESKTSLSMFSSTGKKRTEVTFSAYGFAMGLGWRFQPPPTKPAMAPVGQSPRNARPPVKKTTPDR